MHEPEAACRIIEMQMFGHMSINYVLLEIRWVSLRTTLLNNICTEITQGLLLVHN